MSELTPCNRCNLESIQRRAKGAKQIVTLQTDPDGGVTVYVHPAQTKPTREHFVAWLMRIPDRCVC